MAVDEVVEVGGGEAGFVARVEDGVAELAVAGDGVGLEGGFETVDEGVVAAHEGDHLGDVVVRVEGVFPGEGLVVVVAPVAAAAGQRILGEEGSFITGAHEA